MASEKKQIPGSDKIQVATSSELNLVSADMGIVAFLGRDFELSLLAMSPQIVSIGMDVNDVQRGPTEVQVNPSYSMTAKVRVGSSALAQIATGMLAALKDVEPETFQNAMKGLMVDVEESDADGAVH